MSVKSSVKYNCGGIKFTIKVRHNRLWLDFYSSTGERVRKSTDLENNPQNLIIVKKQILPDIVLGLGKTPQEEAEEDKILTLDEFAKEFFELQKTQIREHTLLRNIAHYNNHISPVFGHRLLNSIGPMELEKWQNKLLEKFKKGTAQRYRSVFFTIFEKAFFNDFVNKNPFKKVLAPKMQKHQKDEEIEPFSKSELSIILENSTGYMKNFIKLMVSTGIRPGEIVALKWNDIDFEKKYIKVEKTRLRSRKDALPVDGDTKTESGNRKVDLLPNAHEALNEQQKLTGDAEYIFLNSSKKPFYNHDIVGVLFKKILEKSGIKVRVLYNLRHTFASQMISNGVDIVWVSKTMGHKDVAITLKKYTKFIQEDDQVRFKKIDKIGTIVGTLEIEDSGNANK